MNVVRGVESFMHSPFLQKIFDILFYSNEIIIKCPLFGWQLLTESKKSRAFLYDILCGNRNVSFHIMNCGWREFGQHLKQSLKQRLLCHHSMK